MSELSARKGPEPNLPDFNSNTTLKNTLYLFKYELKTLNNIQSQIAVAHEKKEKRGVTALCLIVAITNIDSGICASDFKIQRLQVVLESGDKTA